MPLLFHIEYSHGVAEAGFMNAMLTAAAILFFFAAACFALLWQRRRTREHELIRVWNAGLEALAARDDQRVFALAGEMDSLMPLNGQQAPPGETLRAALHAQRTYQDELERGRRDVEDVLASLQDAVLVVDHEAHLRYINASALTLFNVRIEDVLGAALLESLPSFGLDSAVRAALHEGSSTTREMGIYTPHTNASTHDAGGKREILLRVSPVRRGDGRVSGAVAILQDLTEMRRLERVRREFVANASHELRTPIANIRAGAETILCDPEDTALVGRFLPNIVNESERLSRLVSDLLDLARIESNHQATQNPVDLAQVAESVVVRLSSKAARHNIRVHCDCDEPSVVAGDAAALEQVVFNLLDNALAYTPSGGEVNIRLLPSSEKPASIEKIVAANGALNGNEPHVNGNGTYAAVVARAGVENSRLSAVLSNPDVLTEALPVSENGLTHNHYQQGSGERVLMQISDTGIGIPEGDKERIFERFYRVDKARSRSQGGTGLGLAIVKHIVENHNGHVTVQSEVGQGTTFTVSLPAL